MRKSYSSVELFGQCPYHWKLRYLDRLTTIPDTKPDNALYLGLAIHKGFETGSVEEAVNEYKSHYHIITDKNENWIMQIEYQVQQLLDLLPSGGEHEIKVQTDDFVGYIDYIYGDTLYDFKFSNNIDRYKNSTQTNIYRSKLKQVRPNLQINHLVYVMIPKLMIRQKKTETVETFRNRLRSELKKSKIQLVEVPIDESLEKTFNECCNIVDSVLEYPKNKTKLCDWCEFQEFCESNGEITYNVIRKEDVK